MDLYTNNFEKNNSSLYFPKNINKMALTEPTIHNQITHLECHQTWPLLPVSKYSNLPFYFDLIPSQ